MNKLSKLIAIVVAVFAFGAISPITTSAKAQDARIDMKIGKVGFIVGFSGGRGTVLFDGQTYPIKVGGISLGATFAISSMI